MPKGDLVLQVYCKTPIAVLLLGVKDAKGVMRFPSGPGTNEARTSGLRIDVQPLLPINEQLVAAASTALATPLALALDVVQEFADEMQLPDGQAATVYLATVNETRAPDVQAQSGWASMPDILRGMDKDRRRLPYLRAWQILTGGLTLNTKALEASEVLKALED